MRNFTVLAAAAFALTACGSDPAPGPTEQIVVREPGEAMSSPTAAQPAGVSEATDLVAAGEAAFAACVACHVVAKDAASTIGPNLYGIVGQKAAAVTDANYSDALKASGITWTEAELDAYISNPTAKVPGTTMAAGAVADPEQRKAIIAYLKDVSAS